MTRLRCRHMAPCRCQRAYARAAWGWVQVMCLFGKLTCAELTRQPSASCCHLPPHMCLNLRRGSLLPLVPPAVR